MSLAAQLQKYLVETIPTSFFIRLSNRRAIKAFERAKELNPVYASKVDHSKKVKTIEDFKAHVPLCEKNTIFYPDFNVIPVHKKNFSNIKTILVSSGTSGNFSFGLKSETEIKTVSDEADFALESYFQGKSKKTMVVNCLSMGSKLYSSIDCSDVGPHPARALAAIAMAKRVGYEQVFVISLGHIFLKELLEYENSKYDLSWDNVFFFTGGEFFPESARSYFKSIIGEGNPKDARPRITNSGGVTELMINSLFYESPGMIKIRQEMLANPRLRELICGKKSSYTPSIFFWNPLVSHIEIIDGFITVTNLESTTLVPLVRYRLDDKGQIISHDHLKQCLSEVQLDHLMPKEKLPILLLWGRSVTGAEHMIQEQLYTCHSILKLLTANFVVKDDSVTFQLKRGVPATPETINRIQSQLAPKIGSSFELQFIEFEKFSRNMGLNFENKFSYS